MKNHGAVPSQRSINHPAAMQMSMAATTTHPAPMSPSPRYLSRGRASGPKSASFSGIVTVSWRRIRL